MQGIAIDLKGLFLVEGGLQVYDGQVSLPKEALKGACCRDVPGPV
jgi:hypothetical protein